MSITKIDVGTTADDGTGQTLRAAFQRVNDNYDQFLAGGACKAVWIDTNGTRTIAAINAATGLTPETATGAIFADIATYDLIISNGTNWLTYPSGTLVLT